MVDENIILAIHNKYNHEYMTKQLLNKAEGIILNYFQEMKIYIKNIEKELNEKISLKIKEDEKLVEFKIEDEYIIFERNEDCIKVYISNYVNDIEGCKSDEYTSIVPYEDFHDCKYGSYKFQYGDINFMIKKAFKFLKII